MLNLPPVQVRGTGEVTAPPLEVSLLAFIRELKAKFLGRGDMEIVETIDERLRILGCPNE